MPPKTATPQVKQIIRAYIGLLVKFPDNQYYQELTLRQELLPKDMQPMEGLILDSIFRLKGMNILPTRDNVAKWMSVNSREGFVPALDDIVKQVEEEDAYGIPTYSAFVDQWMQNQSGIEAARQAQEIMAEPNPDYADKFNRAAAKFSMAMPRNAMMKTLTEDGLIDLVVRNNAKQVEQRKLTGEVGWSLPFPAHRASFERFKPTEVTTVIANTGYGKTTLMMVIGEHHSWRQKIKSNTIVYELETSDEELGQRQLARHLYIPFSAIDSGLVDLSNPQWKPRIDEFKAKTKIKSAESGHIELVWCPGSAIESICMSMEGYAQASAADGRLCTFWLDNLQRVDWTMYGMKQHEAMTLITDKLSFVVHKYPNCHMFIVAQEYDGRVFGATSVERMSQKMISLKRDEPDGGAPSDLPVMARKDGVAGQAIDALGNRRYYHRKGDRLLGTGTIEVGKINSGVSKKIDILFEGALNRITQDPAQIAKLKSEGQL